MNRPTHDSNDDGSGKFIALIVVLVLMLGYLGYLGFKSFLSSMTERYTDTDPVVLPEVAVPNSEVQDVLDRVEDFMRRVEANDAPAELSLSARDINILINHHPDWSDFAGGVFISIEDDQLHGRISMPISGSGKMLNGRYLNGNAIFRVDLQDGQPAVYIESLVMSDEQLPGFLMNRIRSANLLDDSEWNADSEADLGRVESLEIEDGKLIILVSPDEN